MFPSSTPSVPKIAPSGRLAFLLKGNDRKAIRRFRQSPYTNRVIALEEGIVPTKVNDTPRVVRDILKDLIATGAVSPEEFGPLYSTLLQRVQKYNSTNVQQNLHVLLEDVRDSQTALLAGQDVRYLSNTSILAAFLRQLPPVVPLGQQNYLGMQKNVRLLAHEGANVIVYKTGNQTFLQVQSGLDGRPISVNLSEAFHNLSSLWGVQLNGSDIPAHMSSKLSTNTRMLVLLTAPFSSETDYAPDSFIGTLNRLYVETVQDLTAGVENTEREVRSLAMLPTTQEDAEDLKHTLNALLRGRETEVPNVERTLSPREESIVRFMQRFLVNRIDGERQEPILALDQLNGSFAPDMYYGNRSFIQRMMEYLRKALVFSPDYFREIYSNKYWVPPSTFWLRDYDATVFPAQIESPLDVPYNAPWKFTDEDEKDALEENLRDDDEDDFGGKYDYDYNDGLEEDSQSFIDEDFKDMEPLRSSPSSWPLPNIDLDSFTTYENLTPKGDGNDSDALIARPTPRPYSVYSVPATQDSVRSLGGYYGGVSSSTPFYSSSSLSLPPIPRPRHRPPLPPPPAPALPPLPLPRRPPRRRDLQNLTKFLF